MLVIDSIVSKVLSNAQPCDIIEIKMETKNHTSHATQGMNEFHLAPTSIAEARQKFNLANILSGMSYGEGMALYPEPCYIERFSTLCDPMFSVDFSKGRLNISDQIADGLPDYVAIEDPSRDAKGILVIYRFCRSAKHEEAEGFIDSLACCVEAKMQLINISCHAIPYLASHSIAKYLNSNSGENKVFIGAEFRHRAFGARLYFDTLA
ncbi:MAG TPA: hypothetical protein VEY71_04865, partial [Chitinophagales bacterium]|nr:hypothetical protein [Chitinophagales bacterium]